MVEYVVGYAVVEKGASRGEIRDALESVYAEANERADRGVGEIWSPTAGGGTRPSSVLVRNCASFETAALEMDSDASANLGVKSGAMHFVWSFNTIESGKLSEEHVHQYVGEVMERMGLAHHRSVAVVHRDTIVRHPETGEVLDGNLHVHVAVGSVDPRTYLAYDRTQLHGRMARAEREVEQVHRLENDRGLYVLRDRDLPTERIELATTKELASWRAEREADRLVQLERKSFAGYVTRDQTFERYGDAVVGPRFSQSLDALRERGVKPTWAEMHTVAARYGCELQQDEEGTVILRDVGIGELRLKQRDVLDAARKAARAMEREEAEAMLAGVRVRHAKVAGEERARKRMVGDTVRLDAVLRDDLSDVGSFLDVRAAEDRLAESIRPEDVLRFSPNGIRTRVTAVRGRRPRPLDDRAAWLPGRDSNSNNRLQRPASYR